MDYVPNEQVETSIRQAVQELLAKDSIVAPDLRVDDRDIPQAPNIWKWIIGKKYLNFVPFARHLQVALLTYSEWCPKCSKKGWLTHDVEVDTPLEDFSEYVVPLNYGICPKCQSRKSELIKEGKLNDYNELVVLMGQRSGKSISSSLFNSYNVHNYLKMQNPTKVYGQTSNTTFYGTFIAMTFGQARATVWEPLLKIISSSPWYDAYNGMLDDYGQRYGEEIYKIQDLGIEYNHRSLKLHPSGPDRRTLRGFTRALCVDENTIVTTENGIKYIKNVEIGEKALAFGQHNIIVDKIHSGVKKAKRVELKNGFFVNVSEDHKFSVYRNGSNFDLLTTDELRIGDYLPLQFGGSFAKEPYKFQNIKIKPENHKTIKAIDLLFEQKTPFTKDTIGKYFSTQRGKNAAIKVIMTLYYKGYVQIVGKRFENGSRKPSKVFSLPSCSKKKVLDIFNDSSYDRNRYKFPTEMSIELAEILGAFVSEGAYYNIKNEFSISNTDINFINRIADNWKKVFGIRPRIDGPYENNSKDGYKRKNYWIIRIAYKRVKKFLRHIGMEKSVAHTKSIPYSVLMSTKEHCKHFIRALYEGDGCVSLVGSSYTSYSPVLLQQLQVLLLKFNIYSSKSGVNLNISYTDMNRFMRKIGVMFKEKRYIGSKRIRNAKFSFPGVSYMCYVPNSRIERIWLRENNHKKDINKNWALSKLCVTDPDKAMFAHSLCKQNVILLPIKSIKSIGKRIMYDISVENTNHFTANGIVVHNCAVDELGMFNYQDNKKDQVKMNGEEAYKSLYNSMATLRGAHEILRRNGYDNLIPPMMINLGSPMDVNDTLCKLERTSRKSKVIKTFHYPTWQVNPSLPRDGAVVSEAYRQNSVLAERDFGAVPPMSGNPYITDLDPLQNIVGKKKNSVSTNEFRIRVKTGTVMTSAKMKTRWSDSIVPKIMAIDQGGTDNSYSIVIAHNEENDDKEKIVVLDTIIEIMPRRDTYISFHSIANRIIYPLIESMNVKLVVSDRWESLKLQSELESEYGIPYERYTLKYDAFDEFRNDLFEGHVRTPIVEMKFKDIENAGEHSWRSYFRGKPVAHFFFQLLTVQDIGNTVIKGKDRTDDIFRAAVLAHNFLIDEKYAELFVGKISNGNRGLIVSTKVQSGMKGEGSSVAVVQYSGMGGSTNKVFGG